MPPENPASGYSGTPLVKKLGIKPNFRISVIEPPVPYVELVDGIPEEALILPFPERDLDMIHFFTKSRNTLLNSIPIFAKSIKRNGFIWVSWPKKSAKVPTDVTEDTIRKVALPLGLVDVKVCAINEIWSGLKLVIRKENR